MQVVNIDLAAVELRILTDLMTSGSNSARWEAAALLPKNHPIRFGLLYGAGPRTVERMASKALLDLTLTDDLKTCLKAVKLEADIDMFENWQSNTTDDLLQQRRRENAAIAYAAVEAGIAPKDAPRTRLTPQKTITGRFVSEPDMQWFPREREPMEPESDMEWARR